jgi:hypothetical protein
MWNSRTVSGGSSPHRWLPEARRFQISLPLYGDAGGIADLDPGAARAGPIGAVDPLRHDALGAKLARMGEHSRPILGDVFVQQDASLGIAQQARQRSLPVQEWDIAQILAIMLDQVEGVEDCGSSGLTRDNSSNRDKPSGPSTTASPSILMGEGEPKGRQFQ